MKLLITADLHFRIHNQKPPNFSRLIVPITSSRAMIMRFPTHLAKAGTKNWAGVTLLVPGQLLSAPFPNHIKLDTESGELSWHTSSETWIPEDGLYYHLVLKLAKD
jgi:hypothetical protein